VPPIPARLTRRALEGGPAAPSNAFSVITQGHIVTSGRRDRSSQSLSALCGHPRHCSTTPSTVTTSPMLLECAGTRRRHYCHCATYGPPSTAPSNQPTDGGRPTKHYAATLEAAPVQAQGVPRRPDKGRIRQDGRQLRGTARHTATCREIVRHACKLFPPWPIKGRAVPQPRGHGTTNNDHSHAFRLLHDIGTCLNQYLWDLEARPPLPPRL
jgi:hypothetical protein